ncbi:MAG: MerR family transcriptional regulator [Verrucomicrobia bacterium]|nr:MerR family transcriptional regulator [Verrucomicrobiota bacterium]
MSDAHHAIKVVSRRTGLSLHVIRVWEKRYQAVAPDRTGTNRRLYSEEQIERLSLLRQITQMGHSIGHVAQLPTQKLRRLANEVPATNGARAPLKTAEPGAPKHLETCLLAVRSLDARLLDDTLREASTELGSQGLLQRVIAPLVQTIGELWREGTITAAHEHFASAIIRVFLGHASKPFAGTQDSPVIVITTPAGQIHELGALLAGAAAANLGWHVTYLGVSLPAAEIAGAARQNRAKAVALSLVYPEDDPRLEGELTRLREALPPEITLLVGGRAAPAYRPVLERIGAIEMKDLNHLCSVLDQLRKPATQRKR